MIVTSESDATHRLCQFFTPRGRRRVAPTLSSCSCPGPLLDLRWDPAVPAGAAARATLSRPALNWEPELMQIPSEDYQTLRPQADLGALWSHTV